jgi:Mg-chelatase subunit ChlD
MTRTKKGETTMKLPAKKKLVKPKDASMQDVSQAVKLLAKVCHSDVNGGDDEEMKEITANYNRIKQMANSQTHIGFVLDDSGSMNSRKYSAIRSYNALLQSQASNKSRATFSLDTFKDSSQVIPIFQATMLNGRTYTCSGNTPLYDTIAHTILKIERELGNPSDVVVIIITDGQECSSREWRDPMKLAELVQSKQEIGWQFIYCSSAYQAIEHGLKIGIPRQCVTDFRDINLIFGTISKLLTSYRRGDIKQITFEEV